MTKEQEQLAKLEKLRQDYLDILRQLVLDKSEMIYLKRDMKSTIKKAIIVDLACVENTIRALKKKGVNNG